SGRYRSLRSYFTVLATSQHVRLEQCRRQFCVHDCIPDGSQRRARILAARHRRPHPMIRLMLVAQLALYCFAQAAHPPAEANRASVESAPPKLLWREPRPATVEDWKCGFEGCGFAPAPPFRFVKEDMEGTTAKLDLKDARGRSWAVKFGGKAITEPFG